MFLPSAVLSVRFLRYFCMIFLQDPRSNFATEKNKFLTSVPKVYAAGGEILHRSFSSTFPSNPERMSSIFIFIFSTHAFRTSGTLFPKDLGTRQSFSSLSFLLTFLGLQVHGCQMIFALDGHFLVYLFHSLTDLGP